VLELEDCHRLDQALDYAQNLRQYAFVPRGLDLAEYGSLKKGLKTANIEG